MNRLKIITLILMDVLFLVFIFAVILGTHHLDPVKLNSFELAVYSATYVFFLPMTIIIFVMMINLYSRLIKIDNKGDER